LAHLDLDDAAAHEHVSHEEETNMFIDATNGYPQAGRKPVRKVRPKPIEERRKSFDTLRRTYPNQPRVDAAEVDALFDRTFHHESASTLMIETAREMVKGLREGRTQRADLPTLKSCLQENWRRVHGAAPKRIAA
jgi:hypothetical protein